jgi:hypothetical protein
VKDVTVARAFGATIPIFVPISSGPASANLSSEDALRRVKNVL